MSERSEVHRDGAELDELRMRRRRLQDLDDAVSYVRRVAQGRADLARAELDRRRSGVEASAAADDLQLELRGVLADRLLGDGDRPPRPAEDFSDHPRAKELDRLCAERGFVRLAELETAELSALVGALDEFETHVSAERQRVFGELDALTERLVSAYRSVHLAEGGST